jgi:signal transduction histidine kinase
VTSLAVALLALAALCGLAAAQRRTRRSAAQGETAQQARVQQLTDQNSRLTTLLERTVTRLQLLGDLHKELTERTLDLDALLGVMARRTAEVLGDAVGIYLPEGGQPPLRAFHAPALEPEGLVRELFEQVAPEGQPTVACLAVKQGRAVAFNDMEALFRELSVPAEQQALCRTIGVGAVLGVPLRSRVGAVIGAMLLIRRQQSPPYGQEEIDLAEQVAERAASAIDIARLYRARESFLALAAHELRTPCTALHAQAQLAIRKVDTLDGPQTRQVLQNMERQTSRLVRLINDLLDVSRVEASKLELRRERVSASAITFDLVERFAALSDRHLFVREDHAGNAQVMADPLRLDQVLSNLLTNALKYADAGEVRLTVRKAAREVVFTVRDRGPGIPREKQANLFDRFAQAEGGKRGGLGLGLYLSRELVQRMGGRIWLESDGIPGEGTAVHVALPEAGAEGGEAASAGPSGLSPSAPPPR